MICSGYSKVVVMVLVPSNDIVKLLPAREDRYTCQGFLEEFEPNFEFLTGGHAIRLCKILFA